MQYFVFVGHDEDVHQELDTYVELGHRRGRGTQVGPFGKSFASNVEIHLITHVFAKCFLSRAAEAIIVLVSEEQLDLQEHLGRQDQEAGGGSQAVEDRRGRSVPSTSCLPLSKTSGPTSTS